MDIIKKIKDIVINTNNSVNISIANYILNKGENILNQNIKYVANKCNVSTASVVRFCKILNLEGFNELKYYLKNQNKPIKEYKRVDLKSTNDFLVAYKQIKKESFHSIIELSSELFSLKNKIKESRNIYIFCLNVAYNASKSFVQRMRSFDSNIFLESDPSSIEWYIDLLQPNDLVIFVTLSGENAMLLKYSKFINNKAQTILISGNDSPIKKFVNKSIIFNNKESELWDVYSLRSQSLQHIWDFVYYNFYSENV
ncbi:RpiR family transcriptional regulator [Williamsoniiplasma somnilux]|uniref:RpiR family transcriptional regulator n=1 Tax=Williamsoniiplasma somnilux TaxID=215578 RepID=A0A2K8NXZ3_9MOLU|nr:MurR/RpiR family transcriptional regulator [Williamsoniiplasma somnilux]ATZ18705.1 RpiR family transcriptional regulator [Williamsoniiplasma somnilux]